MCHIQYYIGFKFDGESKIEGVSLFKFVVLKCRQIRSIWLCVLSSKIESMTYRSLCTLEIHYHGLLLSLSDRRYQNSLFQQVVIRKAIQRIHLVYARMRCTHPIFTSMFRIRPTFSLYFHFNSFSSFLCFNKTDIKIFGDW